MDRFSWSVCSDLPGHFKTILAGQFVRFFHLWKEILKKNNEIDQPILFITRDTKEDWFLKEMGLTIGPRPELIEEFKLIKPNLFYCYTTSSFLQNAKDYLEVEIHQDTIEEINDYLLRIHSQQLHHEVSNEDHVLPNEGEVMEQSSSISSADNTDNTVDDSTSDSLES